MKSLDLEANAAISASNFDYSWRAIIPPSRSRRPQLHASDGSRLGFNLVCSSLLNEAEKQAFAFMRRSASPWNRPSRMGWGGSTDILEREPPDAAFTAEAFWGPSTRNDHLASLCLSFSSFETQINGQAAQRTSPVPNTTRHCCHLTRSELDFTALTFDD